jgi:hypothetical protein
MQFGVECALAYPFRRRQRFVEDGEGAGDIACTGFGFGKGNFDGSVEGQDVLFAQKFGAAAHVVQPLAKRPAFSRRHAFEEESELSQHRQIMLAREPGEFDGVRRGARVLAAQQFEYRGLPFGVGEGADMRNACGPRLSVTEEGKRARPRPAATK